MALDADVVIVGGGVAGCVAAIRAADAGATVIVVDKVRSLRRSGDAGRGGAFLTTYLDLGEPWDTPDSYAEWYCDIADGLVDMSVAWPVAIDPLPACCELLEQIGIPLRGADGSYERMARMGTPGPIVLKFEGEDLKPRLSERVQSTDGVRVLGGIHVTSVLQDGDGRAVGVAGFDVRSCEFHTVRAGAVVLAAGNAERVIFNSPARTPFNTYHVPYHGATGFALAARAGAVAANLEFLGTFLFPRGFATGAMGNLLEAGGRLINAHGDLVAAMPDTGERSFGVGIVGKGAREIIAGRGPLYVDCTHFDDDAIARLRSYISYDAPLFLEFLDQSGLDLQRDPIEFELFNGVWSATGSPKGVIVDRAAQTAVAGLFAAGDLATPAYALAGSLTSGWVAGRSAALFALAAHSPRLDPEQVDAERQRVVGPLDRTGPSWQRFEHELQDVMTRFVGVARNAGGLGQALGSLRALADLGSSVGAANGHELLRTHEALDLRLFDEMMTAAALERDESRFSFVLGHYRTDHPVQDDERWLGVAVVVGHDGEAPTVSRTIPTPEWRQRRLTERGLTSVPSVES
jgi:adenylylsulfate reductase, subunit A